MTARIAIIAIAIVALAGCKTLDVDFPKEPSVAIAPQASATLLNRFSPKVAVTGEQSGFRLLVEGPDAFVARALLAGAAERTLDVQYYMIHADDTGSLLADALLRAADRGVRVRVLVDDIYASESDHEIAALDLHENVEVRLFNPWKHRGNAFARAFSFLIDADRLNHRMHNKLFVADGVALIIGGRNLGDEYFDLKDEMNFRDLDVLAVGPVVEKASASFDRFWNSDWAVPAAGLKDHRPTQKEYDAVRERLTAHRKTMDGSPFIQALKESRFTRAFEASDLQLELGTARVLGDMPEKVESKTEDQTEVLAAGLMGHRKMPTKELLISSPYFVPGKWGVEQLSALAKSGVDVRVLTNSLAANDVAIVHSGYKRYRPALLRGGVKLYEFRRNTAASRKAKNDRLFGSENSSLHAKAIVVDRESVYVGSLNLDPRSVEQNTEIGLVIESKVLGERLATMHEYMRRPSLSFAVTLANGVESRSNAMVWSGEEAGSATRLKREPDTGWLKRFTVWFVGLLPFVESQI